MNQIIVLPLEFKEDGLDFFVYPVVLKDENGLYLIDCALPHFLPVIEAAFQKRGLQMQDIKKIIITHHDHDHMGALHEIIEKYPSIEVLCSKEQAPYIKGEKKSLRLLQIEEVYEAASPQEKEGMKGFINMIRSVQYSSKATITVVEDNEILPICGGARVIFSDGHMPGHISLYLEENKTLISGDALVLEEGKLCIAERPFVLDKEKEIETVQKFCNYEIEKIICYHGGEYESKNIKEELKIIAQKGYEV